MLSSPVETRFKNNRESMSNITINKLVQPNNGQLKKSHYYSQSHQILDQLIDENHFYSQIQFEKSQIFRLKYYEKLNNRKSLQSQLIDKYLHENSIQLHRIKPFKQIAFKELVSSSQANKTIKIREYEHRTKLGQKHYPQCLNQNNPKSLLIYTNSPFIVPRPKRINLDCLRNSQFNLAAEKYFI